MLRSSSMSLRIFFFARVCLLLFLVCSHQSKPLILFRCEHKAEVFTGCSNNQFTIVPATWSTTGDDVNNGVITMDIPIDVTCMLPWKFESAVYSKLENYEIDYTYLMMVSPISGKWLR